MRKKNLIGIFFFGTNHLIAWGESCLCASHVWGTDEIKAKNEELFALRYFKRPRSKQKSKKRACSDCLQ